MIRVLVICSLLFFSASNLIAFSEQLRVIFKPNDLVFIEESFNKHKELSLAVAAQIPNKNYLYNVDSEKHFILKNFMGKELGLCEGERFYFETSSANCTGFLVAPQLLVTAGHCVPEQCDKDDGSVWLFEYNRDSLKSMNTMENYLQVKSSNVYKCKKVLEHHFIGDVFIDIEQNDYALILLDRQVEVKPYLDVRFEGKIAQDEPILTIGHPLGLPTILSDNAFVKGNHPKHYFFGDLDALRGNSGGPVFNQISGLVEGLVARSGTGMPGLRKRFLENGESCLEFYEADYYYGGTDITRITSIPNLKFWLEKYR